MGISGSKGKKVAPATEGDSRIQTLQCETSSVSVSLEKPEKDRVGTRRVAQLSTDDRNLADELDRILTACGNTADRKWPLPKNPLNMCESYAFCYNQRDKYDTDADRTHSADIILPSALYKPGGSEDKKDICSFEKLNMPQNQSAATVYKETTHVPGICGDISLAFPVSYDASEEDLMSEIEKEFG